MLELKMSKPVAVRAVFYYPVYSKKYNRTFKALVCGRDVHSPVRFQPSGVVDGKVALFGGQKDDPNEPDLKTLEKELDQETGLTLVRARLVDIVDGSLNLHRIYAAEVRGNMVLNKECIGNPRKKPEINGVVLFLGNEPEGKFAAQFAPHLRLPGRFLEGHLYHFLKRGKYRHELIWNPKQASSFDIPEGYKEDYWRYLGRALENEKIVKEGQISREGHHPGRRR